MLDIRLFRDNPKIIDNSLKDRHAEKEVLATVEEIKKIDEKWRKIKFDEEQLRSERNKLNNEIINAKKAKKDSVAKDAIEKSQKVSAKIKEITTETENLEAKIKELMLNLPNIPDKSVPKGKNENDNPEIRKHGKPEKTGKDVLDHHDLGVKSGLIDFECGVKLAGHRFTVLKGPVARLERALINFMLETHTKKGYLEILPPFMVNTKTITGTGQLPKFADQQYKIEGEDLWLVPTAEVPLTNIFADKIIELSELPIKLTAYTPCFRKEAVEYGRDIKGLIRQHQFDKVELVKFSHPKDSFRELEGMTNDAEEILKLLKIPYRVIELCTGDIGFAAAKTYDMEAWIPSQDKYREISSCSNCTDFQARRANIKFRNENGETEFAHTLNGSGLAVGRTLIAVLENYQEDKKTVVVPDVLKKYLGTDVMEF